MTTQIFYASTAFGVATLVSGLRGGTFDTIDGQDVRRILVTSNNAAVPETSHDIVDIAGSELLLAHFDEVLSYNTFVAPQHPSLWRPRGSDLPMIERHLRHTWSLGVDDVHLVVESIQADPALALCQIFPDAAIDVYADGLMSYGPTRVGLPSTVATRIERLLHLDLVPGLRPVLLTEWGVPSVVISTERFRETIASITPTTARVEAAGGSVAVLLGQYLSAASIVTEEEEHEVHLTMVRGAIDAGFADLVFKPHPTAPSLWPSRLVEAAAERGATLTVHREPELVETWFARGDVGLVVGCFSTAMLTAQTCFGLPVARVATGLLLERLRPYENSNRIPVTLVDVLIPSLERMSSSGPVDLPDRQALLPVDQLVATVAYCMQSQRYPGLRSTAETLLGTRFTEVRPYVKRRRLTLLGLPGALEAKQAKQAKVRRIRRHARRTLGKVIGRARSTQLTTAAKSVSR